MTYRRASRKERVRTGKAHIVTGRGTPPPAPWSKEAIEAADASALTRNNLPPLIAFNLRWIHSGALVGVFDLYLPALDLTFYGCAWFADMRGERVRLPVRTWVDWNRVTHYEKTAAFGDVNGQRFEHAAVVALHELANRTPLPDDPSPDETSVPVRDTSEDDAANQSDQYVATNGFDHHVGGDPGADVPF